MKKLAVLISGSGSNLQSIIDSSKNGVLKDIAEVCIVISDKPGVFGLTRAENAGIKAAGLDYKNLGKDKFNRELFDLIKQSQADIVCMAGYLKKLPEEIVKIYKNRVLNIHPALLPKYGGDGMYGHFVHEAVVKAKEKKSGATVHFADEHYDTGKIIMQKEVDLTDSDTPETVAKKVLAAEHEIYPQAIKKAIELLK